MNNNIFRGYRTQDVLTDINYRGQGIFSNLLLKNNNYLRPFFQITIKNCIFVYLA